MLLVSNLFMLDLFEKLRQSSQRALTYFPVIPLDMSEARKATSSATFVSSTPFPSFTALALMKAAPADSPPARISYCILVSAIPGATALTCMLKSFSSSARVCVNPSTPVFDAEYAVNLGYGEGVPAPEILIILPLRCLFMCGITYLQSRNTPNRLTSIAYLHISARFSSMGPIGPSTPALLTSTSILPYTSVTLFMNLFTCRGLETSPATAKTSAPCSFNSSSVRCSSASVREVIASRAPFLARPMAMARPIPLPAPVITTTLFFNLSGFGNDTRSKRVTSLRVFSLFFQALMQSLLR